MTFKTNLPAASCTALGGFSLLQVDGPDAAAFLQAQSMNDVAALAVGQWQWNGLLTAKGRVVALFALLREQEDRFLLVLPDHPAEELLALLQRYVFRSKVKLQVDTGRVATAGPAGEPLGRATWSGTPADGMSLDLGSGPDGRTLWLVPTAHPALAPASSATDAAWRAADLAQGFPRLPGSQREAWTPQMLSLERFDAFSLTKGCYPGQEIVARTHYLGAAKRGLARLRATTPLEPGQAVLDPAGRTVGTVVCSAATPAGHEALAVVAVDAGDQDLRTEAGDLARLPLDPGRKAGTPGQR
jgi:folate-binding protein YgfZ